MKNKSKNRFLAGLFSITAALGAPFILAGCNTDVFANENPGVYVTNIKKADTASDGSNNYIITYSDGNNSIITIEPNNTENKTSIVDALFNKYLEIHPTATYEEFLREYLSTPSDNRQVVNKCLNSCLKIYTEFATTSLDFFYREQKSVSVMCGSAIIYKMDKSDNPDENYTYVITNYHVVYNANANEDNDNGSNFPRRIVGYMYGSEDSPKQGQTGSDGYQTYDYGEYGIEFEYVGGSIDHDIAILKTNTSNLLAINGNAQPVEMADGYQVGETAIAIGNPENAGISVTEGVVSVDNEYIALSIDGNIRYYRSIRMDTSIYGGSSGGGLFNTEGKLIGVTNAGDGTDQNINYAVPVEVVKAVASNILRNYDGNSKSTAKKIKLGIEVNGIESKYIYDATMNQSNIVEKIVIVKVENDCLARNSLGLKIDDVLKSVKINDTVVSFNRYFEIGDALLDIKAGDTICFTVERLNDNNELETIELDAYAVLASDLN